MKDGITVNPNGKPRKVGSGRRPGSFSFVKIPIADIAAKFADHSTPVPVSRLWAQQVGFQGLESVEAKTMFGQIEGTTPETKVTADVIEFE